MVSLGFPFRTQLHPPLLGLHLFLSSSLSTPLSFLSSRLLLLHDCRVRGFRLCCLVKHNLLIERHIVLSDHQNRFRRHIPLYCEFLFATLLQVAELFRTSPSETREGVMDTLRKGGADKQCQSDRSWTSMSTRPPLHAPCVTLGATRTRKSLGETLESTN